MSSLRNKFKEKKPKTKSAPERFTEFGDALTQHAKAEIVISEELKLLIPPLKEEELVLLKDSIKQEGVRDPLLLWVSPKKELLLVDGHNRYRIIKELEAEGHKVRYGTKHLLLPTFEAVKDWMIMNQLGRRNLTNEQRSYLRGLRYEREKQNHGGERASTQNGNMRTHEKLAAEYQVSKNTIMRDAEFAKGIEKLGELNAALKTQLLAGKLSVKKSDLQLMGRNAEKINTEMDSVDDLLRLVQKLKRKPSTKQADKKLQEAKKTLVEAVQKIAKGSTGKDFKALRQLLDKLEAEAKK